MKKLFNHKQFEIYLYIFSILIYIAYIIYVYASMDDNRLLKVFNSDALYLPTFYQEIITERSGIEGLRFNGQPNFFPDMMLYFIIYSFGHDIVLSAIIYSVIQNLIIILLVLLLSKLTIKKFNYYYPTFINLLFVLILMSGIFGNFLNLRFHLISNGYHTSAFLLSILSFNLFLKYINTDKRKFLYSLALILYLGSLNDKIFILGAVLPLFFTTLSLLLIKEKKPIVIKTLVLITISFLLGLLSFKFINNFTNVSFIPQDYTFSVDKSIASISFAGKYLLSLLINYQYTSIFLFIGYLSYIFIFLNLLYMIITKKNVTQNLNLFLFKVFSIIFFVFIIFTPIFITGKFIYPDIIRYVLFIFYLGLINIGILISSINSKKLIQIFSSILVIFTIFVILNRSFKEDILNNLKNTLSFKPEYIEDIEKIALEEADLKLGISNYWKARQTTLFNNKNLKVYATFYPDLKPNVWTSSNKFWYFDKDTTKRKQIFNFIILENESDTIFYTQFFGKKNIKLINSRDTYILKVPEFYFERKTKEAKVLR